MRRVVVTGMGMVSPLGNGFETSWSRLNAGRNGAVKVSRFDVSDLASQIACEVPRGDGSDANCHGESAATRH
jgi:3-oxoacyl-[acyl-carrier-protein] synthase II